ncbi:hypothetical protein CGH87_04230 [Vibrio parahaemolyticus]|nr:hypothetical protein CGH87_04230 [Vibrio parahaemolyticus]
MVRDGIQKKLPMTLRMSVSSNFHPIPKTKPYRTSMALVEATNLLRITTTSSPKSAMHRIGFGLLQKSHPNMLEKMDRPDQLIFQIGMTSLGRENDRL